MLKRLINIGGRTPKIGIISISVVAAVSLMGISYAAIFNGYNRGGNYIQTTAPSDPFTWVASNDDGHVDNVGGFNPIDPGDDNGPGEYDELWGNLSSNDPSGGPPPGPPPVPGGNFPRYTKDVARTTAQIEADPQYLTVLVENAYPYYFPTVFFTFHCADNIPGKIIDIVVDEDADTEGIQNIPELDVTVTNIFIGQEMPAGEEFVGALHILVNQSAEQNATYRIRVSITTECGQVLVCGTGWAKADSNAITFVSLAGISSNNWGWTNRVTLGSTSFTKEWPLYVGAANNQIPPGFQVGTVTIDYNASTEILTVTYNTDTGYTMKATALWVGTDYLPKNKRGSYTNSPGQFPYKHTLENVATDQYIIDVSGFSGQDIFIAAHADVCWFE